MSIGSMPTEELEQALLEAKWGSAEADTIDVVARLLELPREAVVRVQYAFQAAATMRLTAVMSGEDEIPEEVQNAMKAKLRRGLLRTRVRYALLNEEHMYAHPRALIKDASGICNGCPFSIECVTKSYSTPDRCFKGGPPSRIDERDGREPTPMRFSKGGALVTPLRIRGDTVTVTSDHPRGTFDIDVGELWP